MRDRGSERRRAVENSRERKWKCRCIAILHGGGMAARYACRYVRSGIGDRALSGCGSKKSGSGVGGGGGGVVEVTGSFDEASFLLALAACWALIGRVCVYFRVISFRRLNWQSFPKATPKNDHKPQDQKPKVNYQRKKEAKKSKRAKEQQRGHERGQRAPERRTALLSFFFGPISRWWAAAAEDKRLFFF